MAGLIEEIQAGALDQNMPVDALLRRVKLAAGKLQLTSLATWVESELNGYDGEPPEYRKLYGHPVAWNPYNGWIPIQSDNDQIMETISQANVRQSISSLRDLIEQHTEGYLHFPIPQGVVNALNKMMEFQTARMTVQITRGSVIVILDTVRNMILDWAIEMENKGVLGKGISFDPKEKVHAQTAMNNYHIGSIANFAGNMGSGNVSGDISISYSSIKQIKETTEKIRKAAQTLEAEGVDTKQLAKLLDKVDAEADSSKPDASLLKSLLGDIRSTLSGAAGSMLAEGAMSLVSSALAAIGG